MPIILFLVMHTAVHVFIKLRSVFISTLRKYRILFLIKTKVNRKFHDYRFDNIDTVRIFQITVRMEYCIFDYVHGSNLSRVQNKFQLLKQ